jgi:hypothetical protein
MEGKSPGEIDGPLTRKAYESSYPEFDCEYSQGRE